MASIPAKIFFSGEFHAPAFPHPLTLNFSGLHFLPPSLFFFILTTSVYTFYYANIWLCGDTFEEEVDGYLG